MKFKENIKKYTLALTERPFALYSVCFCIMSLFVFSWIYLHGMSFVDGGDSLTQHYKAFTFYAKYLRNIARTLVREHRLVMPRYSFGLGEGGDIIGTLHYYCIGDPVALTGVFFPERYMHIGYALAQVVRMYISGLFFILLCRETIRKPSGTALSAGALIYSFSAFTMVFFCGHSFFLNATEYLPLVIYGIERVLKRKSPYALILSVMFAALSNFYFFYMIGIMAAVFCVVRVAVLYFKDFKTALLMLLKLTGCALLGMLMAGVILLPQLYVFLGNPKNALEFLDPPFFSLWYYMALPGTLVSSTSFGTVGIILPALIFLFLQKKKYITAKICACIVFVFFLFPFFGSVFNGFSHSLDRWIFLAILLEAYIITLMWDELFCMSLKQGWQIFIGCAIYFLAVILLEGADTKQSLAGLAQAFLFLDLCVLSSGTGDKSKCAKYRSAAYILALVFIYTGWFFMFSLTETGRQTLKAEKLIKTGTDSSDVVKDVAAKEGFEDFYRVVNIGGVNSGLLNGLSSTAFYWSTLNPYEDEFMQTLGMRNNDSVAVFDYDERTIATDIASVRYYGAKYEADVPVVPYGYSLLGNVDYSQDRRDKKLEELKNELGVEELTDKQAAEITDSIDNKGSVYKNDFFLPLMFAYDNYYPMDEALKLNLAEREDVMMDAAVLDIDADNDLSLKPLEKYETNVVSLPYTLEYDENRLNIDGNKYITTQGGTELVINIGEDTSGMELMVGMEGLSFEPVNDYQRYFGDDELYDPAHLYSRTAFELKSDSEKREIKRQIFDEKEWKTSFSFIDEYGRKKGFNYFSPYDKKYSGKHEFLVNLGYGDIGVSTVTVAFAQPGIYNINDILVYGHKLSNYEDRNSKLEKNALSEEYVGVDELGGHAAFDTDKLVYLSVPYSAGWEAFVDGVKTKLYRANYMYSALEVKAGEHEIYLKYHTPYLFKGAIATCTGFVIFAVLVVLSKKRGMRKNESA